MRVRSARLLVLWLAALPALASAQAGDPRDQPKLPPAAPAPSSSPASAPAPVAPPATTAPAATPPAAVAPVTPGAVTTPVGVGPVTAPPVVAPPAPTVPMVSGEPTYMSRLRGLEEKVNELKEKVFRSKARLVLLQEAVLHGPATGAYASIVHKNSMGSGFKLEYASYHLDGQPIYQPSDVTELEKKTEFPIFSGAIVPGSHTISAYLVYRGQSSVFAYWQGYQFKIKSSYTFHFEEGKITQIKCVGYEKGGITTTPNERPSIRFDVDVQKVTRGALGGLTGGVQQIGGQQTTPVGTEAK